MNKTTNQVTIVVPVYGDWSSLKTCLSSLKKHTNPTDVHIMVVNDCGPDADELEANIQKLMKSRQSYSYHRNPHNLGFVQTCNRAALELDRTDNDILLLNSDTKVTKGFLAEMHAVLRSADDIAAVCPRSNNATVFSVPINISADKPLPMTAAYRAFKQLSPKLPRSYRSPVAHGFCMLIRRDLIRKYGLFDEIYGKGYGEENDFCMRLRKHGYTAAVANRAFVFHYRARSFTSEKRQKLVRAHEKILKTRYPDYDKLVEAYVTTTVLPIEWQTGSPNGVSRLISRLRRS